MPARNCIIVSEIEGKAAATALELEQHQRQHHSITATMAIIMTKVEWVCSKIHIKLLFGKLLKCYVLWKAMVISGLLIDWSLRSHTQIVRVFDCICACKWLRKYEKNDEPRRNAKQARTATYILCACAQHTLNTDTHGHSLSNSGSSSSIGIIIRWREMAKSHFLGSLMYPMLVAPLPTPPPLQRFTEIVVLQTTNIEYNPKSTNTFLLHLFILELFPIHFSTLSFSSAFLSYSPPALSFQNPTHPLWSHARSLIFRTNMHRHPAFFFISFHLLSLSVCLSRILYANKLFSSSLKFLLMILLLLFFLFISFHTVSWRFSQALRIVGKLTHALSL